MKKFNKHLYDNINREYDRKNLYLYEVSVLQEKIEAATGKEKENLEKKLNELVKNKKIIRIINNWMNIRKRKKIF